MMGSEQAILEAEGPALHRLTVDEFLILDAAGVFGDRHVELIDGEIFVLSPIHRPHARIQMALSSALYVAVEELGIGLEAFCPVSSHLDEHNLPEPDIVVAAVADEDFVTPQTIRLAVEVAYSSLQHDLVKKAELYARTGVPEYWVVDVKGRRIVRMHRAVDGAYAERVEYAFGEAVASATIDGLVIDTAALG